MKLLCMLVADEVVGKGMDYDRLQGLASDALVEPSSLKAATSTVQFMLVNAAKYDVDENILVTECQQLGLPRENSIALARVCRNKRTELKDSLLEATLALPKLESVAWRVDAVVASSAATDLHDAAVHFKWGLATRNPGTKTMDKSEVAFEMSTEKFRTLFGELKAARGMMDVLG